MYGIFVENIIIFFAPLFFQNSNKSYKKIPRVFLYLTEPWKKRPIIVPLG